MAYDRMDKSVFRAGKLEDQDALDDQYWREQSVEERMRACWHMTCRAYGYDPADPPRMDKTVFSMEKRFG